TGQTKRRQRACKVCSIWRDDTATAANGKPKRGKNTKWLCRPYSKGEAKCYLCNLIRKDSPHPTKTCFQVWHEDWDCGRNIP
ncbi:hypothetical protein PHYSODRAFT_451474, partial [Phytophthora sojae]